MHSIRKILMFFVIVVSISELFVFTNGILWSCDFEPCGPDNPNTMCRYPYGVNRFEPYCMGRISGAREMTDELRRHLLDKHNKMRQKVALGDTEPLQPTAANMMKLRWSMEAEHSVLRWLGQCTETTDGGKHDSCRNSENGTYAGQNLWWSQGTYKESDLINATFMIESISGSVNSWYNEIRFLEGMTEEQIESFSFPADSFHYTAMMWAGVREIGCAWMACAEEGGRWNWLPVKAGCNYVGGVPNLKGASTYKVGENCAECPEGSHCSIRYPGLCTFETEEEEYDDVSQCSMPSPHSLETYSILLCAFVLLFSVI